MAENLFRRILRGRTEPENKDKRPEKKEIPAQVGEKPGLVEKALNVPLSRRKVLGGAATTAGHIASSTAMPQSPMVIQQGVKEAAAILAPHVSREGFEFVRQISRLNKSFEYTDAISPFDENAKKTGEFSPTLENTFARGAPLTSAGDWAHQQFFEMSWLGNLHVPESLTLKDLKDPTLIAEAYRLAGEKFPEDPAFMGKLKDALGVLQHITNISDDKTVGDLQGTYRSKIAGIIKAALDDPKVFPSLPAVITDGPSEEGEKRGVALRYFEEALKWSGGKKKYPELVERIETELARNRVFYNERKRLHEASEARSKKFWENQGEQEKKKRDELQQYLERESANRERRERERFNQDISKRKPIQCSVTAEDWGAHDKVGAKVFYITPDEYTGAGEFHGLLRMHIQHLMQTLSHPKGRKKAVLDDFDAAKTQVEPRSDGSVRVSTTDQKFQKYLKSFVGNRYKPLLVPNRLQMVIPPEKEES